MLLRLICTYRSICLCALCVIRCKSCATSCNGKSIINSLMPQQSGHHFTDIFNPLTPGNTWVLSQHCGYWCPGAKAPGHQYPQCWLNIHCVGSVSYKTITHKVNRMRKWNHVLKKKRPSHLSVNCMNEHHCGLIKTSLKSVLQGNWQ